MTWVLVRGGGDLATGTAIRLRRAAINVVVTELARPLAVRRTVSFSETVYEGEWRVEEVIARRAGSVDEAVGIAEAGLVPVLVDPDLRSATRLRPLVLVDARLTKQPPDTGLSVAPLVVGLGPGFVAGEHCHAVVETQRGHALGRVYWSGSVEADTATPEGDPRRVLRAPADGLVVAHVEIGQLVSGGQVIAEVGGVQVPSPFGGVVRGLIRPGTTVSRGVKIGDIDTIGDRGRCYLVSDKALAVGGGVLEAVLTRPDIRGRLWSSG